MRHGLLVNDPEEARRRGKAAREAALERYGLDRFLADWDELLAELAGRPGTARIFGGAPGPDGPCPGARKECQ